MQPSFFRSLITSHYFYNLIDFLLLISQDIELVRLYARMVQLPLQRL